MEKLDYFYIPYGLSLITVYATDESYDVWYRDKYVGSVENCNRSTVIQAVEDGYLG